MQISSQSHNLTTSARRGHYNMIQKRHTETIIGQWLSSIMLGQAASWQTL